MKKFAPRNGRTRDREQRGANRALEKSAGPRPLIPKIAARGSRLETETKGLVGNRARTKPGAGPFGIAYRNALLMPFCMKL